MLSGATFVRGRKKDFFVLGRYTRADSSFLARVETTSSRLGALIRADLSIKARHRAPNKRRERLARICRTYPSDLPRFRHLSRNIGRPVHAFDTKTGLLSGDSRYPSRSSFVESPSLGAHYETETIRYSTSDIEIHEQPCRFQNPGNKVDPRLVSYTHARLTYIRATC